MTTTTLIPYHEPDKGGGLAIYVNKRVGNDEDKIKSDSGGFQFI